jgi:hypothetical protein
VQHEGICIHAQLGHHEWDSLRHQSGNECDISGEPVELGNDDGAFAQATCGQRRGQLRPPVERVRALVSFNLDELGRELEAFGCGETLDSGSLDFDAKPRTALARVETR